MCWLLYRQQRSRNIKGLGLCVFTRVCVCACACVCACECVLTPLTQSSTQIHLIFSSAQECVCVSVCVGRNEAQASHLRLSLVRLHSIQIDGFDIHLCQSAPEPLSVCRLP